MKNKIYTLVCFMLVLNPLLTGCNRRAIDPFFSNLGFTEDEINTKVQLSAPRGWNNYKIGEMIALNIIVTSQNQIAFDYKTGVRTFIREGEDWVEVENLMKYPEGYIILSYSKNEPFLQGMVGVAPNFPDITKAATIRIILTGNIYQDGQTTNEQTAAYIDVRLNP